MGTAIEYNLHAEACTWKELAAELAVIRDMVQHMANQADEDAAAARNARKGA